MYVAHIREQRQLLNRNDFLKTLLEFRADVCNECLSCFSITYKLLMFSSLNFSFLFMSKEKRPQKTFVVIYPLHVNCLYQSTTPKAPRCLVKVLI